MRIDETNSPEFRSWGDVERAMNRFTAEAPNSLDPSTIRNAQDLIRILPLSCLPPIGVGTGYWGNTIRLLWGTSEVEIFDDRYEFYRLPQNETEIVHFDRAAEAAVPVELVNRLSDLHPLHD